MSPPFQSKCYAAEMLKASIFIVLFFLAIFLFYQYNWNDSRCESKKETISKQIKKLNYCKVKEDCMYEYFACPFGCGDFINKNEKLTSLQKQIKIFNKTCNSCMYKCAGPPESKNIQCVSGKCVITAA